MELEHCERICKIQKSFKHLQSTDTPSLYHLTLSHVTCFNQLIQANAKKYMQHSTIDTDPIYNIYITCWIDIYEKKGDIGISEFINCLTKSFIKMATSKFGISPDSVCYEGMEMVNKSMVKLWPNFIELVKLEGSQGITEDSQQSDSNEIENKDKFKSFFDQEEKKFRECNNTISHSHYLGPKSQRAKLSSNFQTILSNLMVSMPKTFDKIIRPKQNTDTAFPGSVVDKNVKNKRTILS